MRGYACEQKIVVTFYSDDETAMTIKDAMAAVCQALTAPEERSTQHIFAIALEAMVQQRDAA